MLNLDTNPSDDEIRRKQASDETLMRRTLYREGIEESRGRNNSRKAERELVRFLVRLIHLSGYSCK